MVISMIQAVCCKRNCWSITSCKEYLVAFGTGVTVLKRPSLEEVWHITKIKHIISGVFLNDDILAVYTTEQKIYFVRISDKTIVWACPRPSKLSACGDMRCCTVPGTEKLVCIANGKKSLNEHFLVLIDYKEKTTILKEIPDSYRVVHALNWTKNFGLTFLAYEASGNGNLLYKITKISKEGDFLPLCQWESLETINAYLDDFVFMNHRKAKESTQVYKLTPTLQGVKVVPQLDFKIPFPRFYLKEPIANAKEYFPKIGYFNMELGFLIGHTYDWLGIYDITGNRLIGEYTQPNVACCTVLDNSLFVGCLPGLFKGDTGGQ